MINADKPASVEMPIRCEEARLLDELLAAGSQLTTTVGIRPLT